MPASTILLIDADAESAETISSGLTNVGYTVTTIADPAEAFGKVADHQLAIIDVVTGDKNAFDVCKEIRSTPALVAVPILCVGQSDDAEDRIRFLEAGADDVMAKPFDAREFEARVEALLLRFQRSATSRRSSRPTASRSAASGGPSRSIARGAASGRRRPRPTWP